MASMYFAEVLGDGFDWDYLILGSFSVMVEEIQIGFRSVNHSLGHARSTWRGKRVVRDLIVPVKATKIEWPQCG